MDTVPAGTHQIECTCPEYEPYIHPTIAVVAGIVTKVNCRPDRRRKLALNEPIVLLPLRLEIRRQISQGAAVPVARYELRESEPQATSSGLYREFTDHTPVEQVTFENSEYWIRWFPDDIHNWNYVGRFTDGEMEAWGKFHAVFQEQRERASGLRSLNEEAQARFKTLQIYYGIRPGRLSDEDLEAAKLYDDKAQEQIDLDGVGVREALQWQDLRNPEIKRAWLKFSQDVGTVRARHIAKHMTHGKWEFDTLFPIAIDIESGHELEQGVVSPGLRMVLDRQLPEPLPPEIDVRIVTPGQSWIVSDRHSQRQYTIRNAGNALNVYGTEEGETDPLELLLDMGMPVPSLPAYLNLYTIAGGIAHPLLCGIPIKRNDIRISPTDLDGTHWMTDFEQAVRLGMGIKITNPERVNQIDAADWLIAFGADACDDSRMAFEQSFRRNSASGELSLVPNGSPTNNTDQRKTPYSEIETDPVRLLEGTRMRFDLGPATNPREAAKEWPSELVDAEILNQLFAFAPSTLSELPGADLAEQSESKAMAMLLWTPCMHLFQQLWDQPTLGASGWSAIRKHFIENVRARGPFPVIRVGENPYGILPVVSLRDWSPTGQKVDEKLIRFLGMLKVQFLRLAAGVPILEDDDEETDPFDTLLEILRVNAVSNKVDVRPCRMPPPLDMSQDPEWLACVLVKDGATNDESQEDTVYAETAYLSAFAMDEPLSIDSSSPVLKRLLRQAQDLLSSQPSTSQSALANEFGEMKAAAGILKRCPPAKLELLLVEIFDLLSHRLDAWLTSLATARLKKCPGYGKRQPALGAYGWLERPGQSQALPVQAEFIQAPSVQQATTAAVFRSAADSNATDEQSGAFQINLSSERVRMAASYIDGLRQYHDPGELLGAALERMIREEAIKAGSEITETDIYTLRDRYPMSFQEDLEQDNQPHTAHAIIDGVKFLADPQTHQKYNGVKAKLESIEDAGADLGLWEAVDQLVRGNYSRAAAWMDFFEGECLPPELQSINTVRTGDLHGTRIVLPLVAPILQAVEPAATNPRSMADPILAGWCDTLFPGFQQKQIVVRISCVNRDDDACRELILTPGNLSMEPIDLFIGGVEELTLRIRYEVLKRWQTCDPTEPGCIYTILGAFPSFDQSEELLNEVGVELVLSPSASDPYSLGGYIDKAVHLRRLLHRHQSRDMQIAIPLSEMPLLDTDTVCQLDLQATLDELSRRLASVVSQLTCLLGQTISAAVTFKARQLTSRRLERRQVDVRQIATSHQRGEDVVIGIASARLKIVKMITTASGIGDFADTRGSLLNGLDRIAEAAAANSEDLLVHLDALRELIAKIAREFESVVADTAADLLASGHVPFNEVARYGLEKALAVLPVNPTFAEATKLQDLLDELVQSLVARIAEIREAVPGLADRCAALGAVFAHPGRVHSIIASNEDDEARLQALAEGLQLTRAQAGILYQIYDAAGGSFLNATTILVDAIAGESASPDLAPAMADPNASISDRISRVTGWLQQLTDKQSMLVLTPYFLKSEEVADPTWKLDFSDLIARSLDDLDDYRTVRPAIADASAALGARPQFNVYEDRREQRLDEEEMHAHKVGNIDFLYLSTATQLEGQCLAFVTIDEWREGFPNMSETTGVALRYESPQAEAPHALLVAVPPKFDEQAEWTTDILANTLLETIELLKIRLVGTKDVIKDGLLGTNFPALLFGPTSDGNPLFPAFDKSWVSVSVPGDKYYAVSTELGTHEGTEPVVRARRGTDNEVDQ